MKRRIRRHRLMVLISGLALIVTVCAVAGETQTKYMTLEVTDFDGHRVHLRNAYMFVAVPTACDSCPSKIVPLDGIEILIDAEKQIISWETIEHLEKEQASNDQITVFLMNAQEQKAVLSLDTEQALAGDTEQGDYYTLPIQQVKLLKVIR